MMLIKKPAVSLGGITIVRAHLGTLARVAQKNARLIAYNGRPAADHLRIHNITNGSGKDGIRRGYSPGSSTLQVTEVTEVMAYIHCISTMSVKWAFGPMRISQIWRRTTIDCLDACFSAQPPLRKPAGTFELLGVAP